MTSSSHSAVHRTPSPARRRRSRRFAMGLALVLHTLAVLWVWLTWEVGLRGGLLLVLDFPVSLLYGYAKGGWLLLASLVAGGLSWMFFAGLLWLALGALVRR